MRLYQFFEHESRPKIPYSEIQTKHNVNLISHNILQIIDSKRLDFKHWQGAQIMRTDSVNPIHEIFFIDLFS